MKKLIMVALFIEIASVAVAQPNNPYNQRGADYITSFEIIRSDYYSGKANDLSEVTIQYYSEKIPLQNKASVEVAAAILKLRTAGTLDFSQFIQNTSLSAVAKKTLEDVLFKPAGSTDEVFKEAVKKKVDQIGGADLVAGEKELLLSLLAISFHLADSPAALLRSGERRGCWISGPYGQGPGTPAQCAAASAIVGGLIGWSICGVLCGFGGALIGGIAGALS